jgi:aminopeptidase 2
MLDRKEGVFGIPGLQKSKLDDGDFYKINFEQTCFYRTNYTSSALKRLGQSVKAGKLGISDRIGIITDLFALAQGGVTSVVSALELLDNYRDETAYM